MTFASDKEKLEKQRKKKLLKKEIEKKLLNNDYSNALNELKIMELNV